MFTWTWLTSPIEGENDIEDIIQTKNWIIKLKRSLQAVENLGNLNDAGIPLTSDKLKKRQESISKAQKVIAELEADLDNYSPQQIEKALSTWKSD